MSDVFCKACKDHDISFEAIEAKVAEIENAFSFLRDPHIGTALDVITALRARLAEWEAKWRDEYVNATVERERLAEVEGALQDILATPNSEAAQGIMKVVAKAALARAGVTERLMPDPHAGTGTDEKDAVLVPQEGPSNG